MATSYPAEFRRKVLDLLDAGRKVADVAADLGCDASVDLHPPPPASDRYRSDAGSDELGSPSSSLPPASGSPNWKPSWR